MIRVGRSTKSITAAAIVETLCASCDPVVIYSVFVSMCLRVHRGWDEICMRVLCRSPLILAIATSVTPVARVDTCDASVDFSVGFGCKFADDFAEAVVDDVTAAVDPIESSLCSIHTTRSPTSTVDVGVSGDCANLDIDECASIGAGAGPGAISASFAGAGADVGVCARPRVIVATRGSAYLSALGPCALCGMCCTGTIFMLNDRPYCCPSHRLSAYL